MELVQPMLDKADVDHGITSRLDNEFESIRQRLETLTFETTKTLKKAVTQNEFQLRVSEIERQIVRSTENLQTDFKRVNTNFDAVKDKLSLCQQDIREFHKQCQGFTSEFTKVYTTVEEAKLAIKDEINKEKQATFTEMHGLQERIKQIEDELKATRFITDQHTQFIREYELKQNIYQNTLNGMFQEKWFEMGEEFKRELLGYEKRILATRIEMSDEMQIVLRNSRDELLKAFRKEYFAKKQSKTTQANHLDSTPITVETQVGGDVQILGPVKVPNIEYELQPDEERAKSQHRPRRTQVPRTHTPPAKTRRGKYYYYPNRVCCTNSSVSSLASSVVRERQEDIDMRKILDERRKMLQRKADQLAILKAKEDAERMVKEMEEQARLKKEQEDAQYRQKLQEEKDKLLANKEEAERKLQAEIAAKTLEDLVQESAGLDNQELDEIDKISQKEQIFLMAPVVDHTQPPIKDKEGNLLQDDFEMKFLREEEDYFNKFYKKLYPENMKAKGFPDFLNVMRMLETDQQTVFGANAGGSPKNKQSPKADQPSGNKDVYQSFGQVQLNSQSHQPQIFPPRMKEQTQLQQREEMQLPELFPGQPILPDLFAASQNKPQDTPTLTNWNPLTLQGPASPTSMGGIGLPRDNFAMPQTTSRHIAQVSPLAIIQPSLESQFHLYDYVQEGLVSLRDELVVKLNDMFFEHESRNTEILRRLIEDRKLQEKMQHSDFPTPHVPGNSHSSRTSPAKALSSKQGGTSQKQQSSQDEGGYNTVKNNYGIAADAEKIDQLVQISFDRFRNELMENLHSNVGPLRRAQARVIAHLRLEMRSLLRLWSVRQRRDIFSWLGHAQTMIEANEKYSQSMDERSKVIENEHMVLVQQLSRQMSMLQDQFKDMREQQHKILFSSKENDTIYDEENLQSNDEEQVQPGPGSVSFENTQQSLKLNSVLGTTQNRNNLALQSVATTAPINFIPQQSPAHSHHQVQSKSIISPQSINAPQVGFQIEPIKQQSPPSFAALVQQTNGKQSSQGPVIPVNVKASVGELNQASMSSLASSSQAQIPITGDAEAKSASSKKAPIKKISSPFRRQGITTPLQQNASQETTGGESPPRPVAIKGLNKFMGNAAINQDQETSKQQLVVQVDPALQSTVNKQSKKIRMMDIMVQALMSQFKHLESTFKDLEDFKIKDMVINHVNQQMESLNVNKLKSDFEAFNEKMKTLEAQLVAKMREVSILYEEVEGGFSRNARDRSDHLKQYEKIQVGCEGQVNSFRETLTEFQDKIEQLSYCVLSIVNQDEAAQLRLHHDISAITSPRGGQDPNATTRTSGLRVNIAGTGTSEVTAALEHELNQGGVPRRNLDTGRFKNIKDLASEIKYVSEKHQPSINMYQERAKEVMQKSTLLPQVVSKGHNFTGLAGPSASTLGANPTLSDLPSLSIRKNTQKGGFNYTDFVDQALVNSIHNVTLDMSNPHMYKAHNGNPLVRASLQGVVSHRIKSLLGTGGNYSNQDHIPAHQQISRLQAQSVIEYDQNQLSPTGGSQVNKFSIKKKHEKATRDNSLMLFNQLQKNQNGASQDGYDNLKQDITKGQQNRGRSQVDKYPQVKSKVSNHDMKNLTSFEASPMVLQALVGTNTMSKDTIVNLKRRIVEKRGYKEPLSNRSNQMHHHSGLRNLSNPFSQDNDSSPEEQEEEEQ